jgi:hypothetical protein
MGIGIQLDIPIPLLHAMTAFKATSLSTSSPRPSPSTGLRASDAQIRRHARKRVL